MSCHLSFIVLSRRSFVPFSAAAILASHPQAQEPPSELEHQP